MLVLTRRTDQKIVVDERIEISVLRIGASAVRIGIQAPRDVTIRRGELERRTALEINPNNEAITSLQLDDVGDGSVTISCSECH